jgi:hypothetical protein
VPPRSRDPAPSPIVGRAETNRRGLAPRSEKKVGRGLTNSGYRRILAIVRSRPTGGEMRWSDWRLIALIHISHSRINTRYLLENEVRKKRVDSGRQGCGTPRFGLFVARRSGTSFPIVFLDPRPHGPLLDPAWMLERRGPRKAKLSDAEAASRSPTSRDSSAALGAGWPMPAMVRRFRQDQSGRQVSGHKGIVVADHFSSLRCDRRYRSHFER